MICVFPANKLTIHENMQQNIHYRACIERIELIQSWYYHHAELPYSSFFAKAGESTSINVYSSCFYGASPS